ncbi:hypothetical protein [Actinoallomurus sp. NPDC052274]
MRLTKFTDLALRVAMLPAVPAVADEGRTPTAREVAEAVAAP